MQSLKKPALIVPVLATFGACPALFAQTASAPGTAPGTAAAAAPAAPPQALAELKPGVALQIRYKLAKPGKVSLNIYDDKGAVVRELLHGAARAAGDNLEVWDGLDNNANAVPPGKYSWKTLSTPGFKAHYLLNIGGNYPTLADSPRMASTNDNAPGSHTGPASLFVDETGIIVGAGSENIEPTTLKMSLDGKKKLWNTGQTGSYQRMIGFARIGPELWALTSAGHAVVYDPDTGRRLKMPDNPNNTRPSIKAILTQEKLEQLPTGMTTDGESFVLSYATGKVSPGLLRWYDPKTATMQKEVPFENAIALTNDGAGNIYVSNGTAIYRITRKSPTPVKLIDGLKQAITLCVEKTAGDLLVYDGNQWGGGDSQVKRYSKAGQFLQAYGPLGGRKHGLYTPEAQNAFRGVSCIAPMPKGGFVVCEHGSAPRRTAVFDNDGKFVREWYGGQSWGPFVTPEPDNPNAVWMGSSWNSFMRCIVDYKTGTWKVHSTYVYRANEVTTGASGNPTSIGFRMDARMHNGELYLVRTGSYPIICRVDRKNWQIMPVVAMWKSVVLTVKAGKGAEVPPVFAAAVKEGRVKEPNDTAVWTDENGDGQYQENEVQWTTSNWIFTDTIDKDFNLFALRNDKFGKDKIHGLAGFPVKGWNGVGAPLYDLSASNYKRVGPELPAREAGGEGGFLTRDPQSGSFYVAQNYQTGWAASKDSFLFKLNPDGTLAWTVGKRGNGRGQIGYFRRIYGFARGCIAVANTTDFFPRTYVWDADGLFLGSLFDSVDLDGVHFTRYHLGAESINGTIYENPETGEVLLFAHWTNEGRVYRITGWDGWERAAGTVDLMAPASGGSNGLIASFNKADGTRIGQWLVNGPAFDPDQLKSQTAKQVAASGQYLLRFTGQITAPEDGEYTFSTGGGGKVHLLVGGYVAIDRRDGRNTTLPVPLKANQKVDLELEYSPSGKEQGLQLLWRTAGKAEAPVPPSVLYAANPLHELPAGRGTGLSGTFYATAPRGLGFAEGEQLPAPLFTRINPLIDMEWNKENAEQKSPLISPTGQRARLSHWKGYFEPRDSGIYKISADPKFAGMGILFNDATKPDNEVQVQLEAGKKYPITVVYTTNRHPQSPPLTQWRFRLQMTSPYGVQTIPQSQLFPAEDAVAPAAAPAAAR